MYKKIFAILVIVFCSASLAFAYTGGSGTETDPYQIATVADWNDLMHTTADWNKHFVLIADVNLLNITLTPVGSGTTKFTGTLNGNSHIIRNADINMPDGDFAGLFGCISNSRISNLGIINIKVSGKSYVGALAGYNRQSDISVCYSTGKVNGSRLVGGLVGINFGSTITSCYSTCAVDGDSTIGGLAGLTSASSIITCYAAGLVSADSNAGGLVGYKSGSGSVTNCFWDIETSGQTTSSGGQGKTTADMKMFSTFKAAGWDFVKVWDIGEGQTYPFLRKYLIGDLNYDKAVNFADLSLFVDRWLEG